MASIIELQNRTKLLDSFAKVVNIQKIVVMKEIAKIKDHIKSLVESYDVINKMMVDMKREHPSLFDPKLFVKEEEIDEEVDNSDSSELGHKVNKLLNTLTNDSRVSYKKVFFLMSTKPIDKISRYSIKKMAEIASKINDKDVAFITIGDELTTEVIKLGVHPYSSISNKIAFSDEDGNEVFRMVAEMVGDIYNSLLSSNISFVFDDINNPKELHEVVLLPFSDNFGSSFVDKSVGSKRKSNEIANILSAVDLKKTIFDRGLEKTIDFLIQSQTQNTVELSNLSYIYSSKLRELHSLDDKEKNVDAERDAAKLKMQYVRKEIITNELISNSGAFMSVYDDEEEEGV